MRFFRRGGHSSEGVEKFSWVERIFSEIEKFSGEVEKFSGGVENFSVEVKISDDDELFQINDHF